MFYERRIDSLEALIKEAASMDADAGLRILGRYNGRNCYAFVTRFGTRYTIMVYGRMPDGGVLPGAKLAVVEVDGIRGLKSVLGKVVGHTVKAYAY